MSTETYWKEAHQGVRAVSVGWLGKRVPTRGTIPPRALQVLEHYRKQHYVEDDFLGAHTCEICGKVNCHGEFWIPVGESRYVLPAGIFHYIEQHGYCPPTEFLNAITTLPLPAN